MALLTMPRLVLHPSSSAPQTIELRPGVNRFGRAESNDFRIVDPSVSGNHAEVHVTDISVMLRDLGSTNGTFVNGVPVREMVLQSGQRVTFGSVELQFEAGEVSIAIPEVTFEKEPEQVQFDDGTFACLNHTDVVALWRCQKCSKYFCADCVRTLGVAGSAPKTFCPACSTICVAVQPKTKPKPKSFLGSLGDTLRLLRPKK